MERERERMREKEEKRERNRRERKKEREKKREKKKEIRVSPKNRFPQSDTLIVVPFSGNLPALPIFT